MGGFAGRVCMAECAPGHTAARDSVLEFASRRRAHARFGETGLARNGGALRVVSVYGLGRKLMAAAARPASGRCNYWPIGKVELWSSGRCTHRPGRTLPQQPAATASIDGLRCGRTRTIYPVHPGETPVAHTGQRLGDASAAPLLRGVSPRVERVRTLCTRRPCRIRAAGRERRSGIDPLLAGVAVFPAALSGKFTGATRRIVGSRFFAASLVSFAIRDQ